MLYKVSSSFTLQVHFKTNVVMVMLTIIIMISRALGSFHVYTSIWSTRFLCLNLWSASMHNCCFYFCFGFLIARFRKWRMSMLRQNFNSIILVFQSCWGYRKAITFQNRKVGVDWSFKCYSFFLQQKSLFWNKYPDKHPDKTIIIVIAKKEARDPPPPPPTCLYIPISKTPLST